MWMQVVRSSPDKRGTEGETQGRHSLGRQLVRKILISILWEFQGPTALNTAAALSAVLSENDSQNL